jgi:hypothetical protein
MHQSFTSNDRHALALATASGAPLPPLRGRMRGLRLSPSLSLSLARLRSDGVAVKSRQWRDLSEKAMRAVLEWLGLASFELKGNCEIVPHRLLPLWEKVPEGRMRGSAQQAPVHRPQTGASSFTSHTAPFPHHPGDPIRTTPMTRRIITTSLLIGPLAAGIAAWLVLVGNAYLFPSYPTQFELWGWLSLLALVPPVGYVMGLVPSLIAGVIIAGLSDSPLSPTGRVIVAVPVGIAAIWLCWFWLILGMPAYNLLVYAAMFTAAGAIGAPVSVWLAGRPRKPSSHQVLA